MGVGNKEELHSMIYKSVFAPFDVCLNGGALRLWLQRDVAIFAVVKILRYRITTQLKNTCMALLQLFLFTISSLGNLIL